MEEKAQVGKFAIVGILNTLIDVAVLNALVQFGFRKVIFFVGQEFLFANIISVAVAMVNSFILNKQWTFRAEGNVYVQVIKFLVITIIGMFVVHQIVFNLFYVDLEEGRIVGMFSGVSLFIAQIIHFLRLNFLMSDAFVVLNFSKAVAIVVSLAWNFVGYKFFVFAKK